MQILFSFGFQTASGIGTAWEWDTTELYEIQTSSDFRHSLYSGWFHVNRTESSRKAQRYRRVKCS